MCSVRFAVEISLKQNKPFNERAGRLSVAIQAHVLCFEPPKVIEDLLSGPSTD